MIVDGNALAGALADLLGADPTTTLLRCRGCGALDALARTRVFATAMGSVARCRGCDTVLVTVVEAGNRRWVALPGARTVAASG
ncbi:DUF6510 family protein [Curtobacterium sp. 22159]|uniref:DUF6510 family protein n=1 Tax=Curtobacterium sp. 22159 TaxID=3453882 RepID=UPI003F86D969